MQAPSSTMVVLLIGIAFGSIIKGIGEASIKCIKEDCEMVCQECSNVLISNPGQEEAVFLAACQHDEQHIFHTKCLAKAFADAKDGKITCPTCSMECKAMVRRELANLQSKDVAESFQWKMMESMNALVDKDLEKMLNKMGILPCEAELIIKNLADTRFYQLNNAVRGYSTISIHGIDDFYKYLLLNDINYTTEYGFEDDLIACLAGSLSVSQIMAVHEKILDRKYHDQEEGLLNHAGFIGSIALSPYTWIPSSDAYALALSFLRDGLFYSARIVLLKTKVVYTMSTDQAFEIFKLALNTDDADGLAVFMHVWLSSIYERVLEPEKIQQIKQQVYDYAATLSSARSDKIKKTLDDIYSTLPDVALSIDEAAEIIKKLDVAEAMKIDSLLEHFISKGVVFTMMHATKEERKQLYQNILDTLNADFLSDIYLRLPEYMTDIDTDLAILRQFVKNLKYVTSIDVIQYVTILTRRQCFGYEMLVQMLDILSAANTGAREIFCCWLLQTVKQQCFFESLSDDDAATIFYKLVEAELFIGIALWEKPLDGKANVELESVIMENAESIVWVFPKLTCWQQLHVIYQHKNSYLFAILSEHITLLVECLLKAPADGNYLTNINFFITSICGSEHFASNASDVEVEMLVSMLFGRGSAALKYVDAFIMAARSEQHVQIAGEGIFKMLVAQRPTAEDVAAMNEMGLMLKIVNFELTYLADDGSTKVLVPGKIDEPVARMIKAADKHSLLRLLRDKME